MSKVKREKPRSTIDELRAELASRRERVACCEQELVAAKIAVDQYVAKIAEALGLPNPVAREAKRIETLKLRKRVHELSEEGKTIHEIAVELAAPADVVSRMVAKIRSRKEGVVPDGNENGEEGEAVGSGKSGGRPLRLPPEAGQRGWKRERVLALFLDGQTRTEIAEELDINVTAVNSHLNALRAQGRLPPADEDSAAPGDERGQEDDEGDSVQDLREEVARQQEGQRGKAVFLVTTHGDHDHVAKVDRLGDGHTEPDDSGHQHKIYRFVVGQIAGHGHGLLAKKPEGSNDDRG